MFGDDLHAKRVLSLANGTLGVMTGAALDGLPDHQYDLLIEVCEDITKIAAEDIARGQALTPPNINRIDAYLGSIRTNCDRFRPLET